MKNNLIAVATGIFAFVNANSQQKNDVGIPDSRDPTKNELLEKADSPLKIYVPGKRLVFFNAASIEKATHQLFLSGNPDAGSFF